MTASLPSGPTQIVMSRYERGFGEHTTVSFLPDDSVTLTQDRTETDEQVQIQLSGPAYVEKHLPQRQKRATGSRQRSLCPEAAKYFFFEIFNGVFSGRAPLVKIMFVAGVGLTAAFTNEFMRSFGLYDGLPAFLTAVGAGNV